jgi:hypothetical protein
MPPKNNVSLQCIYSDSDVGPLLDPLFAESLDPVNKLLTAENICGWIQTAKHMRFQMDPDR